MPSQNFSKNQIKCSVSRGQSAFYGLFLFALRLWSIEGTVERVERRNPLLAGTRGGNESEFDLNCSNQKNSLRQIASGLAGLRN
ncbi:hypothetical protein PT2222_440020 [Paraburkholderia tropica]